MLEKHLGYSFAYQAGIEKQLIINKEETQFLLMAVGWHKGLYTHYVVFHIELKEEKVWLHENRTDSNIANELVIAGIPAEKIVLHFVETYLRPESGYGV